MKSEVIEHYNFQGFSTVIYAIYFIQSEKAGSPQSLWPYNEIFTWLNYPIGSDTRSTAKPGFLGSNPQFQF